MTRKITMMLAAVLCVASCQDQQGQYEPQRAQGSVRFRVGTEGTESKAAYRGDAASGIQPIDWEKGDVLGIYCAAAKEDKYAAYSVSEVGTSGTVSTGVIEPVGKDLVWGTGDHVFYSCYPEKTKGGIVTGLENSQVSATLAGEQKVIGTIASSGAARTASPDMKNMLMVSRSKTYPAEKGIPEGEVFLSFTAMTTALQFTVKNDTGAELELVEVSLISGNKKASAPAINGAFTVNLSNWSTPAAIPLGNTTITYTKEYPTVPAATSTTDMSQRTVKIAVGTSASPLKLAVNDSFTFTFFVAPTANFDDLTFKFTKKDGSWMSTRLGYTDGTGLLFPKYMKSRVDGILLPKGAQWTVKYGPDVVSWNGESQAIDPMAELSTDPVVTSWDTGVSEDLELIDPYNGHEYVEIAGLKWATCNIGATSPKEYGWYFNWGGTTGYVHDGSAWVKASDSEPSDGFRWANTPYHTGSNSSTGWTKYIPTGKSSYWSGGDSPDNKLVLDLDDDAAYINWGGPWRMPKVEDFQALYEACDGTGTSMAPSALSTATPDKGIYWVSNTQTYISEYTGVAGILFCDGESKLFFPAAGFGNGDNLKNAGSYGHYWYSNLDSSNPIQAYFLYFLSTSVQPQNKLNRCDGRSVRPVTD